MFTTQDQSMRSNLTINILLGGGLLLAVSLGPLVVGVLPVAAAVVALGPVACFTLYAVAPVRPKVWSKKLALVALSICFAVTGFDLITRALVLYVFEDRPKVLFAHRLAALPELYRLPPNVRYHGATCGDLAATATRKEWRTYRAVTFTTDAAGFRNDPADTDATQPLDLVMLGDSFGMGAGTSQERTWCTLLARAHGLAAYNLSMDGASPWQEYITILLESDRLKLRAGTIVLWTFFEGNDLDDLYLPVYERAQLPWRGRAAQLEDMARDFRYRSPLRRILLHEREPSPRADVQAVQVGQRTVLFFRPYAARRIRTLADVRAHPNFAQLQATIGAMKQFTDSKHLTVVIALAPMKEEIYSWLLDGQPPWSVAPAPSAFAQALAELSRQQGIAFLDLKPALFAAAKQAYESSGALLWWDDDQHWNDLGHRMAAAIYDGLLSNLLRQRARPFEP
jgi:hypothetical protein